jgi:hypothetical protein
VDTGTGRLSKNSQLKTRTNCEYSYRYGSEEGGKSTEVTGRARMAVWDYGSMGLRDYGSGLINY